MKMRAVLSGMILALTLPAWAADPTIGRLFFTPSQRASLDVARSQRNRATVATEATQEVVQQPVPQTITYGGMIRRSDGRSTIWLNNQPVHDGNTAEGSPTVVRRVGPDGAVTLEVPQSNRRVDLKVGQSVEVLSGSVGDSYQKQSSGADGKASSPTAAASTDGDREARSPSATAAPRNPKPADTAIPSSQNSR